MLGGKKEGKDLEELGERNNIRLYLNLKKYFR